MRFYKIVFGYDAEDIIRIDETELKKALYVHLTGKKGVFSEGTVSGERIIAIQPDYHRAMGWNLGHKLDAEDYRELSRSGVDVSHKEFYIEAKNEVSGVMAGKTSIASPEVKQLANQFKV